ncbi:MAG: hypothetical protein CUN55_21540 [Phototrophicales bacterium]|nr:MAG: hypothetical protein CUN55_21540 [Phototrophicales bacterium]
MLHQYIPCFRYVCTANFQTHTINKLHHEKIDIHIDDPDMPVGVGIHGLSDTRTGLSPGRVGHRRRDSAFGMK